MTTAFCPKPSQQLPLHRRADDTCQIESFDRHRSGSADTAHASAQAAAERVHWLNGGGNASGHDDALAQAETRMARLQGQVRMLTPDAAMGSTLARRRIRRTPQRLRCRSQR